MTRANGRLLMIGKRIIMMWIVKTKVFVESGSPSHGQWRIAGLGVKKRDNQKRKKCEIQKRM
jgi:hypothetical protein